MNNFIFENSSKVYFGEGCVKEYLSSILSAYGDTVMLCYGGGSIKKSGIYDEVITVLKKENKAVVEFSGIPSNPTYSKVLEGVKLAKESNADLILAVGGGSVMDCCKAISLGAKYDADIWADFWARLGVIDFELLPLGIIVTVSGTGSECNGGAVITNEELKIKTGKDYPQLNAKFVMLDPTYTYSVPKFQMVSGAFDTLSHIMEIYFSEPNESNVSDDISEALMKNVITNLRAAIKNPEDYTARSNLMWDATMAENRIIKLGKKTDFECHQMEHQLGAYTNCNHGAADLFEITPVDPYTSDDLNWTDDNSRVSVEHNDESKRDVPLTKTTPDHWADYDKVFIGYPIWWGIAAWPVNNFVKSNDFSGKTVIPFCTSSSSGLGQSGDLLADMAGTGNWQDGERFSSGASSSKVESWVNGLDLK